MVCNSAEWAIALGNRGCVACSLARDSRRRVRYFASMLTMADAPRIDIFDADLVAADLQTIAKQHVGHERELRTDVAQRLKSGLAEGHAAAEALLLRDRHGRRCAE